MKRVKGAKDRVVFLHSKVKELLEAYPGENTSFILKSQRGGKYSKATIRMIVKNAARKTGNDKKPSPHMLRHTSLGGWCGCDSYTEVARPQGYPENSDIPAYRKQGLECSCRAPIGS